MQIDRARIMKRCLLLVVIISFSTVASAAPQASWPGPASLAGPGITTCTDFEKAYHDNRESNENLFYSWALGFMSGLNASVMLVGHGETDLHELSEQAQKEFLRSTCKAQLRGTYVGAVFDLYNRMRKDRGLPNYFKIWKEPPKTK